MAQLRGLQCRFNDNNSGIALETVSTRSSSKSSNENERTRDSGTKDDSDACNMKTNRKIVLDSSGITH